MGSARIGVPCSDGNVKVLYPIGPSAYQEERRQRVTGDQQLLEEGKAGVTTRSRQSGGPPILVYEVALSFLSLVAGVCMSRSEYV